MSETAEAVRRVISEETGRELHELALETSLRGDLRLDDKDVAHILREVESECDVVFDTDDATEIDTVGKLIRRAEMHRGGILTRRLRAAR